MIQEKFDLELNKFKIVVKNEQGGQDIIVKLDEKIIYYIEVKSRWDARSSITLSPLQMRTSISNKTKYSLCCIDMCDYKNGSPERYKIANISEIMNRIYILNDIGSRVEPLLSGLLSVKDADNEITLTGDYRGTVPQTIVKQGQNLNNFIDKLIKVVKAALN